MKTKDKNGLASSTRLRKIAPLLIILATAIVVRLIYISDISTSPFFNYPLIDAQKYDEFATNLAANAELPDGPFYQPPLYPMFLGLVYWIFGRNLFVARLIQILIGTLNVFFTYKLAERAANKKVAIGAGLAMALYGTMVFFEGELLAPVLIVLLNLISMLLIWRFFESPSKGRAAGAGLLLGLSAIAHPVVLVFAVVIAVYAAVYFNRGKNRVGAVKTAVLGCFFVIGLALPILPCTIFNASRGDFVLISFNGGINFYLGTGADYEKKVAIRPGTQWKELFFEPERAGITKRSEQSRYFAQKALRIIKADPLGYLKSVAHKLGDFANGDEIMRNQEIYPFREYSKLFSILVWKKGIAFPYGLLFPLALMGMILSIKNRNNKLSMLAIATLCHALVLSLFFVTARYRMNVIPFLIVLTATGVQSLIKTIGKKEFVTAGILVGLLAAFIVFSNWNTGPMADRFSADTYYDLGVELRKRGNPKARSMFEAAIKSDPACVDAAVHLGTYLDDDGDHLGAIRMYDSVLDKYPDYDFALTNKGIALFHLRRFNEAKAIAKRILSGNPDNEFALDLLKKLEKIDRSTKIPADGGPLNK